MENWRDHGIVLSVRAHGESGAVVSLLTEGHGRHAGYVRGPASSKLRGVIEPGNLVNAAWSSRVSDHLGSFVIEPERAITGPLMNDPLRLSALISACSLCDAALPEREGHPGLFHGLLALLDTLEGEAWGASYVMWEIAFMRELGFGLDLHGCAAGGDSAALAYVSPKSGRAVSAEKAEPYRDKLLELPDFLKPGGSSIADDEILKGLKMTGYFLEHWVFAHGKALPEPRARFQARMERTEV
ncbi:MAG TPA: DNA repair protein RecO [Micavibrio sp.]|jgi:DNA repair protein RecO (recombination protein O)